MIFEFGNDFTLESTGLAGIGTDVADIGVVENAGIGFIAVVAQRFAVDEDAGDLGSNDLVDDGIGGGGLDQVQNDDIHTLGDEVVDLVGLFSHVVLTIDDGDIIFVFAGSAEFIEVSLQLIAVKGHEVVIELINRDTDFVVFRGSRQCAGQNEDQSQNKQH